MKRAIVLVGHGGVPKDMPHHYVSAFKQCEGMARGRGPQADEARQRLPQLDARIRQWPRTDENDPYRLGIEALAKAMTEAMPGTTVAVAYNEFCAPSVGDELDRLVSEGFDDIDVVTTMMTAGGSHAAEEIPETLAEARARHPGVRLNYHWPVPVNRVASLLAEFVQDARSDDAAAEDRKGAR